jgi:hypothetical protein
MRVLIGAWPAYGHLLELGTPTADAVLPGLTAC